MLGGDLLAELVSLPAALTLVDVRLPDLLFLPLPRVRPTVGAALGLFGLPNSDDRPVLSGPCRAFCAA